MPFSASTCLTYTGNTPLGTTIEIYSDYDSYVTPITSVLLTDITPPNCPYILELPDGTTTVKLFDTLTTCSCFIPVEDLCESCNLNFNAYSADTVSLISVGNITGSCDASITDYKISWYGPGSGSTNVAFTSGLGVTFAPYQYSHPLTGTSAVLVEEGYYTPVLEKIEIDGEIFSNTGGTGTIYASLDCLSGFNVNVSAFTCDNGAEGDYKHTVSFLNAGVGGELPQPMSATFKLSAGTQYFAWKFKGFSVPDQLKLTFSGASYPDPIILEYFEVGSDLIGSQFANTIWPKSADTAGFLSKVTSLTAFTINDGDKITMQIIPSRLNTQTNFSLSCTCLYDFNCDTCIENNTPYKLVLSAITSSTGSCDTTSIVLTFSGCSLSANNSFDLFKYYQEDAMFAGPQQYQIRNFIDGNNITNLLTQGLGYFLTWGATTCGPQTLYNVSLTCKPTGSGTISVNKSIPITEGVIDMEFSDFSDFEDYVSQFNYLQTTYSGSSNSSDLTYYRHIELSIPSGNTCGDSVPARTFYVHAGSSVMTTGGTGPWSFSLTMPTITNDITWDGCDLNCNFYSNLIVNGINQSSTGVSTNWSFTSYTSSMYTLPFYKVYGYTSASTVTTAGTMSGSYIIWDELNKNYPSSGISYTLIPSLSSVTCSDLYSKMGLSAPFGQNILRQYAYFYRIELTDPLDLTSFNILASPITNGAYSGFPGAAIFTVTAATYVNNVVTYWDPLYAIL